MWIRPLDALEATPAPSTTGAIGVAWSPDARQLLVTFTPQQASVVSLDGAQVVSFHDVTDASWGPDGRIYSDRKDNRILRQSVGGSADTLFRGDTSFIISNPRALPGGTGVLFARVPKQNDEAAKSEMVGVSFATGKTTIIGLAVYARVLRSGEPLYASADGSVFIAPFDQEAFRMTGRPAPLGRVAMGANSGRSYPQITVANEGTFIYIGGDLQRQRLAWLDASGRLARRLSTDGDFWGDRALARRKASLVYAGAAAVARRDAPRVPLRRVRIDEFYVQPFPLGGERLAVSKTGASPARWSHDGRSLFYFDGRGTLMVASITSRPTLAMIGTRELPTDVSPGGLGPGRSNYMFDVAADGRIILAEDVPGAFDVVLVRGGLPTQERR